MLHILKIDLTKQRAENRSRWYLPRSKSSTAPCWFGRSPCTFYHSSQNHHLGSHQGHLAPPGPSGESYSAARSWVCTLPGHSRGQSWICYLYHLTLSGSENVHHDYSSLSLVHLYSRLSHSEPIIIRIGTDLHPLSNHSGSLNEWTHLAPDRLENNYLGRSRIHCEFQIP
jgi:hypothetical protein